MSFKKLTLFAAVVAAIGACSGSNAALHDPPRWLTPELKEIHLGIELIGVPTFWDQGNVLCKSNLLGMYIPKYGVIKMCADNHGGNYQELEATLKHEGWHAVQHQCNNYKSAFKDSAIVAIMDEPTRQVLHNYHPKQQRLEAEARLVEKMDTQSYIREILHYCHGNSN